MGYLVDRWTVPAPADGTTARRPARVKGPQHGKGKRWLARWYEPDGRLRSRAFATKDEASAHLAQVDGAVRSGSYVRATSVTFAEVAEAWLGHQLHHAPDTARAARGRLELHAFPLIGHRPLAAISRAEVQGVIGAAETLGPEARRVLYVWVRAVFASAVDDRLIPTSPCVRIRLPKAHPRLVVPLTVEQVRARAAACPPHLRGMLWLGAGTGLRPGELRSLTLDRLDLDGGGEGGGTTVRVDRQLATGTSAARVVWGPTKTSASVRTVRLAPSTTAALREHLEAYPAGPAGLIFTSARRTPLRRSQLQYAWEVATASLPEHDVVPERSGWHELRHHHASLLIAAGMSPRAVADRLGHANPAETLATYAHLWSSDEDRIVGAVEAAYGG